MNKKYQPISCSIHDQLEELATLRKRIEIFYEEAQKIKSVSGIIKDIFVKDGAEFLEIDDQKIRLDFIKSIKKDV